MLQLLLRSHMGLSDRKGSYMHTCMSRESAFQTQGAHGQDNHEGPQSHLTSSAADNPLCKGGESDQRKLSTYCAGPQ